jgi:hypothetical protein
MKHLGLPAIALIGALMAFGCETKKDDQSDKIAQLEQKLARLEASQPIPANVQTVEMADPATLGQFQFPNMEFDFGTIDEGKIIEHTFQFVNTGQAPLIISNVTASCGCTSPDWSKTPVKPGETGFVKVEFNSAGKPGVQAPTVTIQANTEPNVTRLRLKGDVKPKMGGTADAGQFGPVKK